VEPNGVRQPSGDRAAGPIDGLEVSSKPSLVDLTLCSERARMLEFRVGSAPNDCGTAPFRGI
jgi:hypothetical protein